VKGTTKRAICVEEPTATPIARFILFCAAHAAPLSDTEHDGAHPMLASTGCFVLSEGGGHPPFMYAPRSTYAHCVFLRGSKGIYTV
jgi:hypothetical protein